MRVGKRIFISPVGRREINEIEYLLGNSQFIIKSITHWTHGTDEQKNVDEDKKRQNREKGWTDDGYVIHDLDIDYGERPYSVNSSGCARIILERR